jgi:hypothetical protein
MLRTTVAAVVLGSGLAIAVTPMPATAAPPDQLSATFQLDCNGVVEPVTVELQVPRHVRAGQAFAVTGHMEGHVGVVRLDLTGTNPHSLFIGDGTTQVVATGEARERITIDIGGARRLDVLDGNFPPALNAVDCFPVGETRLGQIRLTPAVPTRPTTTAVDLSLYLECTYRGFFPIGPSSTHVSFTAPSRLTPGQVFTLSDLGGSGSSGEFALVVPVGATVDGSLPYVLPTSQLTVTAAPGDVVTIRLEATATFIAGNPAAFCVPYGSGHLAAIPVVAP